MNGQLQGLPDDLCRRLASARCIRALTRDKVADYLGITWRQYRRIESSLKMPSTRVAALLDELFQLDPHDGALLRGLAEEHRSATHARQRRARAAREAENTTLPPAPRRRIVRRLPRKAA